MAENIFISHCAAETELLGQTWGREAQAGQLIGLTGDLGAGKTQLVRGIARGLGVRDRVSSPTFALLNEYRTGTLPLFHLDLYRLETREQIVGAGLEEYFSQTQGVSVIEWIERWGDISSLKSGSSNVSKVRLVKIETKGETERRIIYEDFGA